MPELDGAVLDAPAEIPAEATDLGDALEQQDAPDEPAEEPVEDAEQADDEADSEGQDDEEESAEGEQPQDGRKLPDSVKKGLAALRSVNPEAFKVVRGIVHANQEFRATFPTVQEAQQAKTLIEEIGGTEGVQQIAAEREEWGTLDQQYAEGSKDFVTSIAEANPEAFLKTAVNVVNEWQARAPEQYGFYRDSVAYNTMSKEPGFNEGLEDLYKLHGQLSESPWAQGAIAKVINSVIGVRDRASQYQQKQQSVDPERQKFTQEKQQFEQQRRASFEEGIAKQAETFLSDKMKPEVERILGGRKIDDEAAGTIKALVTQEVQKRLGEIPGFKEKLEAFYRTGDAQKSIDYIKAQYNRLLPEATKKVVAPLYRNITPAAAPKKAAAPTQGTPAVRAEVTLRDMPEWKDIDFSKCTTADVANGWAILKSGHKASGW